MIDDSGWGIWSRTATWTSGVGGTTTIRHNITAGAGNVIHILQLRATATIAATGTLDIDLLDEDGAIIVKYADLAAAAIPDATIPRLNDDVLSTSDSPLASSHGGVWLAGSDVKLSINPGTLANADTVVIALVAKVMKGPGAVTTVATGLYPESISVNEVY